MSFGASTASSGLVFAAALWAGGALAHHGGGCHWDRIPLDRRDEPTVAYEIVALPFGSLQHVCQSPGTPDNFVWGCASQEGDDLYYIYIDKTLTDDDLACVIAHEKAHLPPNAGRQKPFDTVPGSAFRRLIHYQIWLHWV